MEKAAKNSKRLRLIELCIFLSGLSVFAQLYLFQPLLPTVAQNFHTSVGDSSLLVSSSTIGMAAGLFFFAFRADAFQRKSLMLFSLFSSAALTILSFWVYSLPLLIAIGILKGFVISGVSAVALAYITEEVALPVLGVALSTYLSGNTIGGMSGRIFATLLAGALGWRNAVIIIGVECLLLAVIFWKFFPSSRFFQPQKINFSDKLQQMRHFLLDGYLIRLYLIAALLMGSFVSVYNYLTFRLESQPFSLSHLFIAFIFLMYVFGVFGTMITGKLSEKYEQRQVLKAAIFAMLLGVLCIITQNLYVTIVGLGLLTLAFFGAHTMASRMVALHAKEGKSAATSIYWLFYYLGSSVLGSGTGYFLHATSWSYFVCLLAGAVILSYLLSFKKMEEVI